MKKRFHKIYAILTISFILFVPVFSEVYGADNQGLIDIRFKDAHLQDVVRMLAEQGGYNIVGGAGVSGKVTFDLRGVTVLDALDAALRINGYGMENRGGILFIKNAGEIESQGSTKEEPQEPRELELRSYKLNYIDAAEISSALKESSSPSGKITVNKSNNIIVVEDTRENVDRIEAIIRKLDVIPKQVLIEAKILEIRLNDETQLGIDWRQVFKSGKASFTLEGANFSVLPEVGTPGLYFNVVTPHFEMFLDALRQKGDLRTLATPKLVAMDNKEAQIIIGGRLGYRVTTTINQVTTESVEFLDIGTMLKITPHIGDDGNIFLSIYPKISDGVVTGGLPSETTTEVTTKVVVRDGESIFIGGLIRDRREVSSRKIPILGDIPIVGSLFGRKVDNISKVETVILISPHIVDSRGAELFKREKETIESIDKIEEK